jgi:hypothetical protein
MKFPKLPRLKPLLRVQAYFCIVATVVLGAKAGLAYKTTEKTFKDLGGQLAGYLTMRVDGAETVQINGERFAFATTSSDASVDEILSATEQACAENSGNLSEEIGPILNEAKHSHPQLGVLEPSKLTTLRRDDQKDRKSGDVTCFTRPADDGIDADHIGFVKRLERFTDTMAFGELGEGHYLRADREQGTGRTRVLYVRSLSEMKMSNLFGGEGDAPGRDPSGLPRPPSSTRTFSASIERTDDGFYSYESKESPAAVLNYYDDKLKKDWEKMALDEKEPELQGARAYAQQARATYLIVEPRPSGGSDVGLVVLGKRDQAVGWGEAH